MNKKRELIRNTLIIGLGKVSTQLVSFALLPLYTFFLSPDEYGAVDLIITYIIMLVPAITIQLEMASFRFLIDARDNEMEKKMIISNISQMIAPILVVFTGLYTLLNLFINLPYAKLILLIVAVMIFSSLFLQFARGFGDNRRFAIGSIANGVTTLIATIWLVAFADWGVEGILASLALANLISCLYLFIALKLYKYISFTNRDKSLQKKLIQYSAPLVPNGISWWVINVSSRTIVSTFIGVAANGIYAVANKYAAIFGSIFSIFFMSWTESASVHINDADRDTFFSDTSNAIVRLFGSLGLILIAYIPLVFSFLVSPAYNEAYLYIPILIIGAFLNTIVGLYSGIYIAKKMTRQVANTSMMAAVINITLTLGLISTLGLFAAAIATTSAFLAMAIYRHYDIKKYVGITYEKNIFIKIAIIYTFTMILYYYNTTLGNITNAVIVTVIAIIFNKSIVRVIKHNVDRRKQQHLMPNQEVQEGIL